MPPVDPMDEFQEQVVEWLDSIVGVVDGFPAADRAQIIAEIRLRFARGEWKTKRQAEVAQDSAELGAMVRRGTQIAHEHARLEVLGKLKGYVTPFGGTVTDPDELQMYRELYAANITVCGQCFNTGWATGPAENLGHCPCPYGVFLAKKEAR